MQFSHFYEKFITFAKTIIFISNQNRLTMKKTAHFGILILFATLLLSCKQQDEKALLPDLVRAEAMMYEHPDSALHLLETMQMPTPSDKLQNATWCLLMTQARDKNYMEHTSDSLINIAYDYFMKQEDPQRKAMVLNYEGTIHLEAFTDVEKATQLYQDASKEVEKTKDYQLGYLIYINLGNIYAYRHISEYAMQSFQKAHKYAKLSNNKAYIAYSLSYVARAYSLNENWNKTIEYYMKAYNLAKTTHNNRIISGIANELSNIYNQTENYELAIKYVQEAIKIHEEENTTSEATLLTIGDIYRNMGNIDSACYYLNKAALSNNIYTCCSSYQALWYLNRDLTKDYKKALEYSDKFWVYTDSIQTIDRSKELIKMKEQFDQEKILNEKNQLQIKNDQITSNALLGIIILLCLIAFIIYTYQRRLIRKERTNQKNKEQIRSYTMKIHENESIISYNESRIKELSAQIEASQEIQEQLEEQQTVLANIQRQNSLLKQENTSWQKSIAQYSSSLQEKDQTIDTLKKISEENRYLHDREKHLCHELFKKEKAYKFLKRPHRSKLNVTEWKETFEMINEIHNNFTKRLSEQIPSITESELQLGCLIKLGLSISEMAMLLNISKGSVSKKKQRLKEQINKALNSPLGKNQALDLWLMEY